MAEHSLHSVRCGFNFNGNHSIQMADSKQEKHRQPDDDGAVGTEEETATDAELGTPGQKPGDRTRHTPQTRRSSLTPHRVPCAPAPSGIEKLKIIKRRISILKHMHHMSAKHPVWFRTNQCHSGGAASHIRSHMRRHRPELKKPKTTKNNEMLRTNQAFQGGASSLTLCPMCTGAIRNFEKETNLDPSVAGAVRPQKLARLCAFGDPAGHI